MFNTCVFSPVFARFQLKSQSRLTAIGPEAEFTIGPANGRVSTKSGLRLNARSLLDLSPHAFFSRMAATPVAAAGCANGGRSGNCDGLGD
jgi:hypothetical protein